MALEIRRVEARPLNAKLAHTFAISSASQDAVTSVLVELMLSDGSVGYGECAPMRPFTEHTQEDNLAAVGSLAGWLEGQGATRVLHLSRELKERLPGNAPCRAAIEMALLDALCRHWKLPMYHYFGGASDRLKIDYTISVGTVAQARADTKAILKRGITEIKVKIGKEPALDLERLLAIQDEYPSATLILDANQAYTAAMALKLLKQLKSKGIVPVLFEQPVPKEDLDGLAEITRGADVPVCADESVQTPEDATRIVKLGAARAINVKLMKSGLFDGREIAVIAKAAGLELMIGGMVETRLAMTAAAHLAAGLGGFRFIDIDTPLFFAKDPMRGPGLSGNGVYDLAAIKAGIGVTPRPTRR